MAAAGHGYRVKWQQERFQGDQKSAAMPNEAEFLQSELEERHEITSTLLEERHETASSLKVLVALILAASSPAVGWQVPAFGHNLPASHLDHLKQQTHQRWRLLPPAAVTEAELHRFGVPTMYQEYDDEDEFDLDEANEITQVNVVADEHYSKEVTWEEVGVTVPDVADHLREARITYPNAIQRAAFKAITDGRDVILHAWTGSGKTVAFLLPLLERLNPDYNHPQALILCPSRELAFQVGRVAETLLNNTVFRAGVLAGGANPNRQLEKIRKERPQIIIGSQGRIIDLAFDRRKISLNNVRHLVIDEVDAALARPVLDETLQILSFLQNQPHPLQIITASATADTPTVRRAAVQLLDRPVLLRLVVPSAKGKDMSSAERLAAELPPHLRHGSIVVPERRGMEVVRALFNTYPPPKMLVFVNSPYRAKYVFDWLDSRNVPAAPLYGLQQREERLDIMQRLLDGRLRVAVTTELAARGLDIPEMTHVVNLELPADGAHYIHRAGRCGRAGARGTVLTIADPGKINIMKRMAKRLNFELDEMMVKEGKLQPYRSGGLNARQKDTRKDIAGSDTKAQKVPERNGAATKPQRDSHRNGAGAGPGKRTDRKPLKQKQLQRDAKPMPPNVRSSREPDWYKVK